jgi:hypothetical protein
MVSTSPPQSRRFRRIRSQARVLLNPVSVSLAAALIAFAFIIYFSRQGVFGKELPLRDTLFLMTMGLLGSSIFLLYNFIAPVKARLEIRHNFVRLLLGPIAGWISYSLFIDNPPPKGFIWLPFLAGFSSDLLIGIINQFVRAIKITLGIENGADGRP